MQATLTYNQMQYRCDLSHPMDLSIPIANQGTLKSFFIPAPEISPLRAGGFVGDVNEGGSCNCDTITFTPHGNGTHTECVGHISQKRDSINDQLKSFHFIAMLVSVHPKNGKIEAAALRDKGLEEMSPEALIIRTIPNESKKKETNYSGTDPIYLSLEAIKLIRQLGIKHLLLDIPSVDKEDDPRLAGHHAFWNYPENPGNEQTITEFIYVKSSIDDGIYLLNLQVAAIESDASPSRPVIFKLEKIQPDGSRA